MSSPFSLFEVSWEICNMVGGIHTVISTKAQTAVDLLGDDYIAVGPWLLSDEDREVPFDDEPGHEQFCESCRSQGLPVRVGRWRIPGSPRTILIEFSRLYEHKDDVLSGLWDEYGVDSISGEWDYIEPVLFGHAAGMVIERWWEEYLAPTHKSAIVHAHEWMTGSCLLYLKPRLPSIGTVFTTHATMLGRALSSLGHSPSDGLGDQTAAELADEHNVVAKHSLEGVCAREADVFTTVSEITADEAELLHERRPDPLLPNGIDLAVIDQIAGDTPPAELRARLVDKAGRFLGEDVSDATLLAVSGRYEFHNKGIDLLLEALAELNERKGPRVVLFVLVPAGNSGLRSEVRDRWADDAPADDALADEGPIGICTHNLFDEEHDPVQAHCERYGLDNAPGSRVKVMQVPIYLGRQDGFLNEPYEAVLRTMDLSCFPSYYEPWGYTPQESLAVGVPSVTADYAGFGRWAEREELGPDSGLTVLSRVRRPYAAAVDALVGVLDAFLGSGRPGTEDEDGTRIDYETCRETAARTEWSSFFDNYKTAYGAALNSVRARADAGVPQKRRARRTVKIEPVRKSTPRLTRFDVTAPRTKAPDELERIARNFWWSWDPEATALFTELDPQLWESTGHNPVAILQQMDPKVLARKSRRVAFRKRVESILARLQAYLAGSTVYDVDDEGSAALSNEHPVVYLSAEFGLHESLPIYGGGLGILAGDHLKSASDIGLPLVGVGLFYRKGYIRQRLTATGEQTRVDRDNDPHQLALECVRTAEGEPLEVHVQLPGRRLHLRAWRVRVGRVSLYLLDTDTPSNRDEDRMITERLYGGDEETRVLQEIVLGRGGARLLRRLWIRPAVWHMNEGHAAFLSLERVARLMREEGLTFDAAREIVRATTAFTTHTPVPAGHDRFNEDLMRRYFSDVEDSLGLPWEKFHALGRDGEGNFNMTHLALSFASRVNGVSKLHGIASRALLKPFWPGLMEEEVPVSSITNGIHLPTWTSPEITAAEGGDAKTLWAARTSLKQQLVEQATASLSQSFLRRNDSPVTLHRMLEGLDENALFIGFARRFAPYKRAHLLFQDLERLQKLLADETRPVRILIAGKAHPRDQLGKDILRTVAEHARGEDLIGKVFFLENYDMAVARTLVQGVDVWLNTPTRMQEASGTSGMKAAANGGLNLSVADGWWPEAYDGENGWTIGEERVYDEQVLQDQYDAAVLYRLLEEDIVPLYFKRNRAGTPTGWMTKVAHDLATIPPVFNTDRMVRQYYEEAYRGLGANYYRYVEDRKAIARDLGQQTQRIRRAFGQIKVLETHVADLSEIRVGESIRVRLDMDLGTLEPEDVRVELVFGRAKGDSIEGTVSVPLHPTPQDDPAENEAAQNGEANGRVRFEGAHRVEGAGQYAHGLRVRARHGEDAGGTLKDLVFWA